MRLKKFVFTFSTLFQFAVVIAQNGFTNHGLPGGYSAGHLRYRNDLKIDSNNNVWIAFQNIGLGKYDGSNWTVYNPSTSSFPDTTVYSICFDQSGNLWAGTNKGLVKYDGTTFTVYDTSNCPISGNNVYAVACNGNDIWIGTAKGAVKFNGSWITYNTASGLISDTISCFAFGQNGEVWIGTRHGLSEFYNNTWINHDSLNSNLSPDYIRNLYVDAKNDLWIGCRYGFLSQFIYRLKNGVAYFENFESEIYTGSVTPDHLNCFSFLELHFNKMWFLDLYNWFESNDDFYDSYPFNYYLGSALYGYEYEKNTNGTVWLISKFIGDLISFDFSNYPPLYGIGLTNFNLKHLDINDVKAAILNRGDMHWNLNDPGYEVPKGNGKHAVFSSALWIGGLDQGNQLHVAAMTYRQNGCDFWPGPIDTVTGLTDTSIVANFDRIWKIDRFKIEEFKYNYLLGNVQNGTYRVPRDIKDYPGVGSGNVTRNLAPFFDNNNDGLYNIMDGDCPLIKGDQMLYWIFNDNLSAHTETGGLPFGFEIHASAYAYTCPAIADSNVVLNQTTLYQYKIINRSQNTYHDVYIGLFCDGKLGNYIDDYVGCDTLLHIGFEYNGDNNDDGVTGYGLNPPMINVQILQGPVADSSDGLDNNKNGIVDESGELCMMNHFQYFDGTTGPTSYPVFANEYYGYLKSIWRDGLHVTYGAGGRNPGNPPTDYMFSGIPYDTAGWTEQSAGNLPGERKFVLSSGPFSMDPGQEKIIDFAYVFTRDSTAPNGLTTSIARNIADLERIKNWFDNNSFPSCLNVNVGVKEIERNNMLKVFPNPSQEMLWVKGNFKNHFPKYEITDITGSVVLKGNIITNGIQISSLSMGIYLLYIFDSNKRLIAKFVKW